MTVYLVFCLFYDDEEYPPELERVFDSVDKANEYILERELSSSGSFYIEEREVE